MKFKRLALLAISAFAALGMASCGETTNTTTTTEDATTVETTTVEATTVETTSEAADHTIKWQWTGVNTEMANFGFAYSYELNLYADGTLDGYGYLIYSLDTSDAETNKNLTKWYDGVWAIATDDNDDECIKAVVNYADGVTGQTGQAITGKNTYNIGFNSDGVTPLNISGFGIPIGISGRSVTIEYNANPYLTLNDFINGTAYQFEEPAKYAAIFEDNKTKERLYLFADNTGYDYGSKLNEDGTLKGYYPKGEVTWAYQSEVLSVTIGGIAHEAVIAEDNSATITWEEVVYGDYKVSYNFYCADVTPLTATESGGSEEEGTTYSQGTLYFDYVAVASSALKCRFVCEASVWSAAGALNYTAVEGNTDVLFAFTQETKKGETAAFTFQCLKDGTYAFEYSAYSLKEVGTWTFNNYSFKYVDSASVEHTATMAH